MKWSGVILALLMLGPGGPARAQVTNAVTTSASAFICTGSRNYDGGEDLTGLNFGNAGTLAIAPAAAAKGEFESLLQFNLAGALDQFNRTYGSNHWAMSGLALKLTSNYGMPGVQPNNPIFNAVSGGRFVIEWLADNDWQPGTGSPNFPTMDGVCYDSMSALLAQPTAILCTNTYAPPGNNIPVVWPLSPNPNILAELKQGGFVTFRLYAADQQIGYLFNSAIYGRSNQPLILVVASPLLTILSGSIAKGIFHLTGSGGDNALYQIQATINLATTPWKTIGTAATDTNGFLQFSDPATIAAQRFYRLSQ